MEQQLLDQLAVNRCQYWQTMGKVSKQLNCWLTNYCQDNPEFRPIADRYVAKKAHLNGIQFYAGYLAGGGEYESWKQFMPVVIALEMIMIWAYALNQIVDRKKALWVKPGGVELAALEHDLLLALLLQLLEESQAVLGDRYQSVLARVMKLLVNMSKGFWIERQHLNVNITSLEQILPNWQQNYNRRNRLIDQVYDDTPLVGYFIATGDLSIYDRFESFFTGRLAFSESGQVLNDLSDFLVGSCDANVKSYQDAFADLRNGYITYPVWRLLDSSEVKEALTNPHCTYEQEWQNRMGQVVRASGLAAEVRACCMKTWDDQVEFWHQQLNRHDLLLLRTYSLLGFNKYYKQLER